MLFGEKIDRYLVRSKFILSTRYRLQKCRLAIARLHTIQIVFFSSEDDIILFASSPRSSSVVSVSVSVG